jgi:hypothetical protein
MLEKTKNNSQLLLLSISENNIISSPSGYVSLFCIVFLFLIILFWQGIAKTEQPKPINVPLAPIDSSYNRISFAEGGEEDLNPFFWMIKLYKRYISPINSSRCPMYPSCSSFTAQALRYHGEKGLIMAFDRLLRCGRDLEDYTLLFKRGRVLYYDPAKQGFEHNTDESSK